MDKKKFIRLEKRDEAPALVRIANPLVCIILAFVFCGLLIVIMGNNPIDAYVSLLVGAFGSWSNICGSIQKATPLILCSLSVAMAFRMKLMNIGAEGQMTMGVWAAAGVGLFCTFIPEQLALPSMFVAAFVAGGVWAMISILPKVLWNVNEVIVTLLMNYVAIYFTEYFIYGPWKDPEGHNMPFTATLSGAYRLPKLGGSKVYASIIIAVVMAVILYFVFKKTVWGYKIAVVGESRRSAEYAGINIRRNILLTMLIGGGMAGLAGFGELAGTMGLMKVDMADGVGYTAIIIAYLSHFNPLMIILTSFLFGGLQSGGFDMQLAGLPVQIITMLQGAILLFVLGGQILLNYKIHFPFLKTHSDKRPAGRQ